MSGGRWFVGSFEQTLPPIVPRFRTCTSAIVPATSPRMDRAPAACSVTSSEYVVIAPISTEPLPRSRTPRKSSRSWRSTSTSGDAARAFMTLTSVCPPASGRAPSCADKSPTASSTVFGRAYCTSRRSIGAFSYTRRVAAAGNVAILGGGKIGESLLSGLLSSGWRDPSEVVVTGRRDERLGGVYGRDGGAGAPGK